MAPVKAAAIAQLQIPHYNRSCDDSIRNVESHVISDNTQHERTHHSNATYNHVVNYSVQSAVGARNCEAKNKKIAKLLLALPLSLC